MYEIWIVKISVSAVTSDNPANSITPDIVVSKSDPILVHSDVNPLMDYKVLDAKLKMSDNAAGSLEFTVPPTNVAYDDFSKCLITEVIVKKEGEDYWFGRLLSIDEDFWKQKKVVFEGELSYLMDTIQLPQYIYQVGGGDQFAIFMLEKVIEKHNELVAFEPYKKFELGEYPSEEESIDDIDAFNDAQMSYGTTLDLIRQHFVDKFGLHIYVTHNVTTGVKRLNIASGYIPAGNTQVINFGENLLDFATNVSGDDYCTVLIPRGKRIEREVLEKNAEYRPSKDLQAFDSETYYEQTVEKNAVVYKSVSPVYIGPDDPENDVPKTKGWYVRQDYVKSYDMIGVWGKEYYSRTTEPVYFKYKSFDSSEAESSDENPKANNWYYYTSVSSPTGNPSSKMYYEKNGSNFVLTDDTTVKSGKTYYTVTKCTETKPVAGRNYCIKYGRVKYDLAIIPDPLDDVTYCPKKTGWFEKYNNKKNKEEYASLVGATTGPRTKNGVAYAYVDGQKGFIYNLNGIKKYGYIYGLIDFEDLDTPSKIDKKACAYIKKVRFDELTLEVSAVDLHYLNPEIQSLELLDQVTVVSEPHGLNQVFPVTDMEVDLLNPENTKFSLGTKGNKSIASSSSKDGKTMSNYISDTKVAQQSPILESAAAHANDIIKKSLNGSYASFIYTVNGSSDVLDYVDDENKDLGYKATGIRVANKTTDAEATNKWVWYSGGLAHYTRSSKNVAWGNPNLALTMDGKIMATMITAGTLKVGGNGSTVAIQVYDGSTNIGSWGNTGINIKKGSINLGSGNFVVDNNGNITAKKGSIDIGGQFKVDTAGNLTASSASITGAIKSGSTITGSTITGSSLKTKKVSNKQVLIEEDRIEIYNTSNNSSGYLRVYQGAVVGNFHKKEFGIASDMCHAAWNNGESYAEVEPQYIIQVAKYWKEHPNGWQPR